MRSDVSISQQEHSQTQILPACSLLVPPLATDRQELTPTVDTLYRRCIWPPALPGDAGQGGDRDPERLQSGREGPPVPKWQTFGLGGLSGRSQEKGVRDYSVWKMLITDNDYCPN